jgi:hypothetical protein
MLAFDIFWAPYDSHWETPSLQHISFYSCWTNVGQVPTIVSYLPVWSCADHSSGFGLVCTSPHHSTGGRPSLRWVHGSSVDSSIERQSFHVFASLCVWVYEVIFSYHTSLQDSSTARRSAKDSYDRGPCEGADREGGLWLLPWPMQHWGSTTCVFSVDWRVWIYRRALIPIRLCIISTWLSCVHFVTVW